MHKNSVFLLSVYAIIQSTCNSMAYLSIKMLFLLRANTLVGPIFNNVVYFRVVEVVIFRPLPIPSPLPHLSLPLPSLSLPPLPLPPAKSEKTTVDNFINFCGTVACLLHFIIFRGQKSSFIAITLATLLKLIIPNYSAFLLFRY